MTVRLAYHPRLLYYATYTAGHPPSSPPAIGVRERRRSSSHVIYSPGLSVTTMSSVGVQCEPQPGTQDHGDAGDHLRGDSVNDEQHDNSEASTRRTSSAAMAAKDAEIQALKTRLAVVEVCREHSRKCDLFHSSSRWTLSSFFPLHNRFYSSHSQEQLRVQRVQDRRRTAVLQDANALTSQ